MDDSDSDKVKFYLGDASSYISWDGSTLSVIGGVEISSVDIPDTTTASSFHVDSSGNNRHGTGTSMSATVADGKLGGDTAVFDGTDDKIGIDGLFGSPSTITLQLWIRPDSTASVIQFSILFASFSSIIEPTIVSSLNGLPTFKFLVSLSNNS